LSFALFIAWAGMVAGSAQMVKSPLNALTPLTIGQEYAQQQARVIQFVNEQAITTTFVPAPSLNSTSGSAGDVGNWMKVEFHYGVNPEHPDKYPWVNSAQFKVWIEGRDLYDPKAPAGSQEGVAVCLTGSVTYINLQQARDAYGVFYVHPSVLARYCGSGTYENFDRKYNIHIEAYVGGKLVDYFDKTKDADKWWTLPVQVPNLVCRQDQTPFVVADTSRYPQAKLPASDSGQ